MSKVLITDTYLSDIADAIRSKNGSTATYKPSAMAAAIDAIDTSGSSGSSTYQYAEGTVTTNSSGVAAISTSDLSFVPDALMIGFYDVQTGSNMNTVVGTFWHGGDSSTMGAATLIKSGDSDSTTPYYDCFSWFQSDGLYFNVYDLEAASDHSVLVANITIPWKAYKFS